MSSVTCQKISVEQASEILGISPHEIRYGIRNNQFDPPIGRCRKARSGESIRYDVYRNMVNEYAGIRE